LHLLERHEMRHRPLVGQVREVEQVRKIWKTQGRKNHGARRSRGHEHIIEWQGKVLSGARCRESAFETSTVFET
jgi:hypothetical protein